MSEEIRDTSLEEKAVPDGERLEDEYDLEGER
jgi:hypothetical protein